MFNQYCLTVTIFCFVFLIFLINPLSNMWVLLQMFVELLENKGCHICIFYRFFQNSLLTFNKCNIYLICVFVALHVAVFTHL